MRESAADQINEKGTRPSTEGYSGAACRDGLQAEGGDAAAWASGICLLKPRHDVENPVLSIVIPALNESRTIKEFMDWCHEGIDSIGVTAEIVIVDSSSDGTAEIALQEGARVLKTPQRGLGRAYSDALPFIRGKYVVMGDCDCTYDFRDLTPFKTEFDAGAEYIMGSRFKGSIEPGAMPVLHRYLGTPVTGWILNRIFGSQFSDIHCGMRGITLDALKRMALQSQSWEYASEMVLKSIKMGLRTSEVPISFLKDRNGRQSHHKREGWFSPWRAAWINLKAMFIYGADFFLLKPGIFMLVLGLVFTLPLSFGPVQIGSIVLSIYWMLLGLTFTILGLQSIFLAGVSQILSDYTGEKVRLWRGLFQYSRSVIGSVLLFVLGLGIEIRFVYDYVENGYVLRDPVPVSSYMAVTGLIFMMSAFQVFGFTLVVSALGLQKDSSGEK